MKLLLKADWHLKIPFGRITKDGQRYLLELTIEDGLSLRKAKRRLKNTFGDEDVLRKTESNAYKMTLLDARYY